MCRRQNLKWITTSFQFNDIFLHVPDLICVKVKQTVKSSECYCMIFYRYYDDDIRTSSMLYLSFGESLTYRNSANPFSELMFQFIQNADSLTRILAIWRGELVAGWHSLAVINCVIKI